MRLPVSSIDSRRRPPGGAPAALVWRRRLGRLLLLLAVLVTVGTALAFLGVPRLVIWERGTSMPTGIYLYAHGAPFEVGDVIVMDDAPNWGRSYLMKRVEGVPGDHYCWDPRRQAHVLQGRLMPAVSDRARALGIPVWEGCRPLRADEYVGYGAGSSYDSRHLGPIPAARIDGGYVLVVARARP